MSNLVKSAKELNLDNDYQYFNFFQHNSLTTPVAIMATNTLKYSLIDEMSRWEAKILKFTLPLYSVPIAVFHDNGLAITDPAYLSEYWIGFSIGPNNDRIIAGNLIYFKTNNLPDNNPESRFFYTYSDFLASVNNALKLLWAQVILEADYMPYTNDNTDEDFPYILLSNGSEYLQFILPCGETAAATPFANPLYGLSGINILMNNTLYELFLGFPLNKDYGLAGIPGTDFTTGLAVVNPNLNVSLLMNINQGNLQTYQVLVADKNAMITVPTRFVNVVPEDVANLYTWNEVTRILFKTAMPVFLEDFSVNNPDNPGGAFRQQLLEDYEVPSQRFANGRDVLNYVSIDDNRWFNFIATGPLKFTQLEVLFQLQDLRVFSILLDRNKEFLLKLALRRRPNRNLLEY